MVKKRDSLIYVCDFFVSVITLFLISVETKDSDFLNPEWFIRNKGFRIQNSLRIGPSENWKITRSKLRVKSSYFPLVIRVSKDRIFIIINFQKSKKSHNFFIYPPITVKKDTN